MTFAELRSLWKSDLYRHTGQSEWTALLKHLLFSDGDERFSDGVKYAFYFRLCRFLYERKPGILFRPMYVICRLRFAHYKYKFGVSIPHMTQIGRGLYIGHPRDIVISDRAIIGDNCNLSQSVTIGQANRGPRKGTAIIGNNVYIGPGAKIVGAVHIGNHVAIGANCVVTTDVPDYGVVVGIPGRVISFEGSQGYVNRTDYDAPPAPRAMHEHDESVGGERDRSGGGLEGREKAAVSSAGPYRAGNRRCAP